MDFMSFVCDYALIDPVTLCYKISHVSSTAFANYEDIDEDCFRVNVYPYGKLIPVPVVKAISGIVKDYLFDE